MARLLPLTLTAADVGHLLGYKPETVFRLVRSGKIPGPIDSSIGPKLWRWSRREIERYVDGQAVAS